MEAFAHTRGRNTRGQAVANGSRGHSRNKKWVAGQDGGGHGGHGSEGERWERGTQRKSRGTSRPHTPASAFVATFPDQQEADDVVSGTDEEEYGGEDEAVQEVSSDVERDTPEERERFYQEVRLRYPVDA